MEEEQITIAWNTLITSKKFGKITDINPGNFEATLDGNGNYTTVDYMDDNQDNGFLVEFESSANKYTVDSNGEAHYLTTGTLTKYHVYFYRTNGEQITDSGYDKMIAVGNRIGRLPEPKSESENAVFKGWCKLNTDIAVTSMSVLENQENLCLYEQWTMKMDNMDNDITSTLEIINEEFPNSVVPVEIPISDNIEENVEIGQNVNIVINLQGNSLENAANKSIINNSGTVEITNGVIESSAGSYAAVDNTGTGVIRIKDATIISHNKQAISNKGGKVYIEGDSYIESTGAYTVHNRTATSEIYIYSGTIVGKTHTPISNTGYIYIGVDDGVVDPTSPVIQGAATPTKNYEDAIRNEKNTAHLYIYDGIVKAIKTTPITVGNGTISPALSSFTQSTETIDTYTFTTLCLSN